MNELDWVLNEKAFRSVTATSKTVPRTSIGPVREVTVTLTGDSEDLLLGVHTGAWFRNLAVPGATGLLAGDHIRGVAAAGISSFLFAFKMFLWQRYHFSFLKLNLLFSKHLPMLF